MSDPLAPRPAESPPTPRAISVERALLALAMALLCVITMANVVVRYFTNFSFAFTEEISVWLMVFMTLVGTATAFQAHAHINVTFLVERLPAAARRATQLVALAACSAMFGVLAWYGTRMAYDDFRYEVTSPALGLPQWIYSAWLPLLSFLIVLRLLQMICTRLRAAG